MNYLSYAFFKKEEDQLLENGEPASMAQLLKLFSGKKEQGPSFTNQVTVLEDGNVAPGQAFKPK